MPFFYKNISKSCGGGRPEDGLPRGVFGGLTLSYYWLVMFFFNIVSLIMELTLYVFKDDFWDNLTEWNIYNIVNIWTVSLLWWIPWSGGS